MSKLLAAAQDNPPLFALLALAMAFIIGGALLPPVALLLSLVFGLKPLIWATLDESAAWALYGAMIVLHLPLALPFVSRVFEENERAWFWLLAILGGVQAVTYAALLSA